MTIPSLFKNRPFCLYHSLEGCSIVDNLGISINKAVHVCIRMCVVLPLDDFLKILLGILLVCIIRSLLCWLLVGNCTLTKSSTSSMLQPVVNAVWSVILVLQQSGRCSSASWVKLKTSNLKLYNNVLGKYFNISLAVTRSLSDELVHLIMWINCWSLYYIHCFLKFKPSWKQKRRSAWRLNGISVL